MSSNPTSVKIFFGSITLIIISLICSAFTFPYQNKNLRSLPKIAYEYSGLENGHEWVDLGLPSGTLWATCNLGASSVNEYGEYFSWAKVKPTDFTAKSNFQKMEEMFDLFRNNGYINFKGSVDLEHDAARNIWGGNWRIPTLKEMKELVSPENTVSEWTNKDGVYGRLIKSKINGKCIFLPAAGFVNDTKVECKGELGRYLSSGPISARLDSVGMLNLSAEELKAFPCSRKGSYTVRPVRKRNEKSFEQKKAEMEKSLEPTGIIGGHEYVDLGLPSGLLWGTCNVGAQKPEEYGDLFAWGELEPKDSYKSENCETHNKDIEWLLTNGYIVKDGTWDYKLTPPHDVANHIWGERWRMPTDDEFWELFNNTTHELTKLNGVEGFLIKSKKNNKSIFLPSAGIKKADWIWDEKKNANYWTQTPDNDSRQSYAKTLQLRDNWFLIYGEDRYSGCSVRPVTDSKVQD